MSKDLTTSQIDRQNILNNSVALGEIQKAVNIKCIVWNEKLYLTKDMVASFFDVDIRTIERYISKFGDELTNNRYLAWIIEIMYYRNKCLRRMRLWIERNTICSKI